MVPTRNEPNLDSGKDPETGSILSRRQVVEGGGTLDEGWQAEGGRTPGQTYP